jgi:hypothetical protein
MIGRDSRDDMDGYGKWPWLGGVALCAFLIFLMFQFAKPIS